MTEVDFTAQSFERNGKTRKDLRVVSRGQIEKKLHLQPSTTGWLVSMSPTGSMSPPVLLPHACRHEILSSYKIEMTTLLDN